MAKTRTRWVMDLENGTIKRGDGNKYNLIKLFPNYHELANGQKYAIAYGVQQKLSDVQAGKPWMDDVAQKTFNRFLDNTITNRVEVKTIKKRIDELKKNGLSDVELALLKKLGL